MKTPLLSICALVLGALTAELIAEDSSAPAARATNDVGISARDGVTISAGEVLVTRNRLTEKLHKELVLTNGTRVKMDGTVIPKKGREFMLSPTQVLMFDGRLVDVPVNVPTAPRPRVVPQPAPVAPGTAVPFETPKPATPKGHIKAGEGVQK